MNNLRVLISTLSNKKVVVVEGNQADVPFMQLLLLHNIDVCIKNTQFVSPKGTFGEFIFNNNVEQLPPNYYNPANSSHEFFISGGAKKNGEIIEKTPMTSELQLVLDNSTAKTIGVTGSFGKQTTTHLISQILKSLGYRVFCRERNKTSMLMSLSEDYDFIIFDLSLEELTRSSFKMDSLVVTNLSPYPFDPKKKFLDVINAVNNLTKKEMLNNIIVNHDNYFCRTLGQHSVVKSRAFSYKRIVNNGIVFMNNNFYCDGELFFTLEFEQELLKLPGSRNLECYLAAITLVKQIFPKINPASLKYEILNFNGAEGHIEWLGTKRGRNYFNNAYSTSPAQTVAALSALKDNIILITGGVEKNVNFKALGMEIVYFCNALILIGKASTEIKKSVMSYRHYKHENLKIYKVADIPKAIKLANYLSKKDDNILYSLSSHDTDKLVPYLEHRSELITAIASLT